MSIETSVSPSGVLPRVVRRLRYALLFAGLAVASLAVRQHVQSAPIRHHIDEGIRLLQKGNHSAAEVQWREAIRLDPQNAQVWELLGDFHLNSRNYPAALDAYSQVHKLNSESPGLQARMAICALKVQDLSSARRYALEQLAQNAGDTVALETLATVEKQSNNPEAQLKHLTRLVELQPANPRALTLLANELAAHHEYDKVLPLSERLVELAPNTANSYLLRGVALYTLNPNAQALSRTEADFRKLAELDPNDVESDRYLARLYMRRNQPLKAIEHYKAISRKRSFASAHFLEMSNAYRRAGNLRRAEELRALFMHLKQLNARIRSIVDRINLSPNTAENYLQLGALLLKSVQAGEADYQLYRYRVSKRQLQHVGYYLDYAVRLRPSDAHVKAANAQLEAVYRRHLQATLEAARRRDFSRSQRHMSRVMLLRADDPRTRHATRQLDPTGLAVR
jgi:tetratricopeptide (TPR) repeat protein